MKLEYTLEKISNKKKTACVGDLIKYYGEIKYKIVEQANNLSRDKITKSMVANLIKQIAANNPAVDMMLNNIEELAKKELFSFTIDGFNPLEFDNGKDSCVLVLTMNEEWFAAQALGAMIRPGFRKFSFNEHLQKEKNDWKVYVEKNLRNDYTKYFKCRVLEE